MKITKEYLRKVIRESLEETNQSSGDYDPEELIPKFQQALRVFTHESESEIEPGSWLRAFSNFVKKSK